MAGLRARALVVAVLALLGAALAWPTSTGAEPAAPREDQQALPFTGLSNPRGVEVDQAGNVYVVDSGNDRVLKMTAGTGTQVVLGFTGLVEPQSVAVDTAGNVYVSDSTLDAVFKLPVGGGAQVTHATVDQPEGIEIDAAGNLFVTSDFEVFKQAAGSTTQTLVYSGGSIRDVAVDRAGNVFAADDLEPGIVRIPAGGGPATLLPVSSPRAIAVDPAGDLFATNDTSVVKFTAFGGSPSTLPFTDLSTAQGIAVDDFGSVYVTTASPAAVRKLPLGFGTQSSRNLGWNPGGVAVDAAGNLYVADTAHNRVAKLPAGGGAEVTLGFTGLSGPNGVAVDVAGNVFVADTLNNRVLKLPPVGSQSTIGFTGLAAPEAVAVDALGNVYVADTDNNRILKLPIGGGPQVTLGFSLLFGPMGLAVDRIGDVYVADTVNSRVLRLPAGGGSQVTLPFIGISFPSYVAVDADRNVYISNGVVLELAGGAQEQLTLGFTGLSGPTGVAVGADGTVHVGDPGNQRVASLTVFPPELRVTTSPAVAADITVDGIQRDSWGLNWAQFPLGPHQVCFGEVLGFVKPPCQTPTLSLGSVSNVQGTYTPNGYLRVLTSPAVASTISVDGVPRNDWGLWAEVAPGTYNVCFGNVAGRNVPSCRNVTVVAGATATTTGTFTTNAAAPGPTESFGYLRAVTNPASAAMISVDGVWRDNWGLNWVKLPVGAHEVCFGPAPNLTAPSCQNVVVTSGNTNVVTGTYVAKGFLRVLTSPAVHGAIFVNGEIANAWGMWTAKPAGTYNVCFGAVPGRVTPPCQPAVSVTSGNTTTITGIYAPA